MSFSADWLTLRGEADERARSPELIAMAAEALGARRPADAPWRIVDLGAGTGATLRALAARLPRPQAWTLVDADAALLAVADRQPPAVPADVTVATRTADLTVEPAPWERPPDLVTASALFDLASSAFVEALADRLATDAVPLLTFLTYDGRLEVDPGDPFDEAMIAAFNAHQRGVKSFGPALGPDATDTLHKALAARGFTVHTRETPWVLEQPRDRDLMRAKITGWADAALERTPDDPAIAHWRDDRLARAERIVVGHQDLFAVPPAMR